MKRVISSLVALALVALIAAPLWAQDEAKKPAQPEKKKAAQQGAAQGVIPTNLANQLEKANLTEEQKKKLEEIKAKFSDKLAEARRAVNAVLTRELRQARQEATAKAREEGKSGEELRAAVAAALKLTDEQAKALADAEAKVAALQTEIRQAVIALLTPEQRAAAGINQGKKKPKAEPSAS